MKKKRGPVSYTTLQKGEEMKTIEGFPHYYVTNFGRILSTRPLGRGYGCVPTDLREITLSFGGERYYYCNIYNENGFRNSLRVHRLVWQHFNSEKEGLKEGFVIDHIDGDRINNHISNLRQITHSENSQSYHKRKKELQNV